MSWKFIVIVIALIVFAFLFKELLRNRAIEKVVVAKGVIIQATINRLDSLNNKSNANERRIDTLIYLINKIEKKDKG